MTDYNNRPVRAIAYEDNGGFVHVVTFGKDNTENIILNIEESYGNTLAADMLNGMPDADQYDPDEYGKSLLEMAGEISLMDDEIAIAYTDGTMKFNFQSFGAQGAYLFSKEWNKYQNAMNED